MKEKEASNEENKAETKEERKIEETGEKPKEQTETKPKMKKKNAPGVEVPVSTEEKKQSKVEPAFDYIASQKAADKEVIIEEEKVPESKPLPKEETTTRSSSNLPSGFTDDKIKKGQEELGKMVTKFPL